VTTVETARLYLRPWCEDDVDELLGLYADAEVMRYISGGRPFSRERVLRMLEHALKKAGERRYRSGSGRTTWSGSSASPGLRTDPLGESWRKLD